jgi:hypothetical protein
MMTAPPASRQPVCAMNKKKQPATRKTGETAQLNQNLRLEIQSYIIRDVEAFIAQTRPNDPSSATAGQYGTTANPDVIRLLDAGQG